MDEIWGFAGKKDCNVRMGGSTEVGSVWAFCANDAETRLGSSFRAGHRDLTTTELVRDVASRKRDRVQISTDAIRSYAEAVEMMFGADVDYAQAVKIYRYEKTTPNHRYSPSKVVSGEEKITVCRRVPSLISTGCVGRLNATARTHMRRLTRLTLAFGKKLENFEAAVWLHFACYNFVSRHNTLRRTPGMAAGVTGTQWSIADLAEASAWAISAISET